jgi:hypothetical protein
MEATPRGEGRCGVTRRRSRGRTIVAVLAALLLAAVVSSSLEASLPPRGGDPRAAGMGEAYTALARGALAPLWNPAGIITSAGVQGALATGFLSGGEGYVLLGAAIVAQGGPAVAWGMVDGDGGRSILGTLAFSPLPATFVGGSLVYVSDADPAGLAISVGWRSEGDGWALGVCALDVGAGLFGLDRPPQLLLGVALRTVPAVMLEIDLHVAATGTEIALGGVADLQHLAARWGTCLGIDGGLKYVGLGASLPLFGQQLDAAVLLLGSDLELSLMLGLEARFAAWW